MLNNNPVELIKKLVKNLESDWIPELEDYNLHKDFYGIYGMDLPIKERNIIIAFVVFAYDNKSTWLDIRRDRLEDKKKILKGLGANPNDELFSNILNGENKDVQEVYMKYLHNQKDARFRTVLTCFEFYSTNMITINEKIDTLLADDKIEKIKNERAKLLQECIRIQKVGEDLLKEIKTDYAQLDKITETELGFEYTEPDTYDIMFWSHFIERRNKKKEAAKT